MKRFPLAAAFWTMCGTAAAEGAPQEAIELYVDTNTRQLFAEPGPGRQRLGKFAQVSDTPAAVAVAAPTVTTAAAAAPATKAWYEKIGIRGYVQLRYNQEAGGDAKDLKSPGDRYIGREQGFGIRRARVVISGDVTDRMSIYIQPDFASTPTGSSTGN